MSQCTHKSATGIGSSEYRTIDDETYRVERWRCDDCRETFLSIFKQVAEVDLEEKESVDSALESHI